MDFLKTRGALCSEPGEQLTDSFSADDRFIVKEISRLEMDALTRFAPAYFQYMAKAFYHKVRSSSFRPTAPQADALSVAAHSIGQDLWLLPHQPQ